MTARPALFAICGVLVAGWSVTAEGARKRPPPTLGTLSESTAPIDRSVLVQADLAETTRSYEAFLRIEGADPTLRAQALRRLGDLRLEQAVAMSAASDAPADGAAALARDAVATYRDLLDHYPSYPARDAALYQLARAFEVAGDASAALAALDELVARYPDGAHADEAQFRRGETFFATRRYVEADRAYAAVLGRKTPSAFHEQALYKRGWAQFKLGEHAAGSASFLALLDRLLVVDGALRDVAAQTRPEQELADDALRALSLMFAAEEGAASLQAALARRGTAPYEARLYRALGDLYVEKERYQDGAEVYRAYARRQPMDPEAALLLGSATEAYARAGFVRLVLDSKQELVELYGPRSRFWTELGTARIDPRVSAAVQSTLLDLARHYHALAQKTGNPADRDAAVRWYRDYLDGFDDSPEAAATRLLLADLLFEARRYAEAAVEYDRAAYGYPNAAEAARAGYAVLVALDRTAPQVPAPERAGLDARVVEASLKFADAFPAHVETPAVLTRACKLVFDADDRERAESLAQRVLALGPRTTPDQQRVAWTVLAHTYFDSSRYAEAERAYAEVVARLAPDDPQYAESVERRAASIYRQAETRRAAGDVDGAVQDFLRVGAVAAVSPIRAKAEFDAATLLLEARRWPQAAQVFEQFRRDHPTHELARQVEARLAVAYLEAGESTRAAAEYERVAARADEETEVRRAAQWQAAELYAAAADRAAATRAYAAYVDRFPVPAGPAIEARQTLADYARDGNDASARQRWLEAIVAADLVAGPERSDRTRLLAATATLELARPLDAQARAIRLVLPLDRSLTAKRRALEAALATYGRAEGYGIAQVTTAAVYAMADLYRELGRALLESDRPDDLAADELEQYDLLLEEQAFPFEEKAIALHERNTRHAAQGTYDEWVQRSYADLAQLKPGRYARDEVVAAPGADVVAPESDPASLNQLAVAQRRAGAFREARENYERALAIDANYADAVRNLAILHDLYLHDPAAALTHYERYQAITGGADAQVTAWLAELRTRLAAVTRTAEVAAP
ncbi:MAG TPA: tetratricopeptide repeat protein [Steroidobacteraceae bacterium]|nr:tetratricopeptide repeat protein [Steroidobacteraceae bacterium]